LQVEAREDIEHLSDDVNTFNLVFDDHSVKVGWDDDWEDTLSEFIILDIPDGMFDVANLAYAKVRLKGCTYFAILTSTYIHTGTPFNSNKNMSLHSAVHEDIVNTSHLVSMSQAPFIDKTSVLPHSFVPSSAQGPVNLQDMFELDGSCVALRQQPTSPHLFQMKMSSSADKATNLVYVILQMPQNVCDELALEVYNIMDNHVRNICFCMAYPTESALGSEGEIQYRCMYFCQCMYKSDKGADVRLTMKKRVEGAEFTVCALGVRFA
jgi:hypothetical protein